MNLPIELKSWEAIQLNDRLTHINKDGEAIMVDVGDKAFTKRSAKALSAIKMQPDTLKKILDCDLKKGDALACARIAGIMGAKHTSTLIPLCHNIPIEKLEISFDNNGNDELYITCMAETTYKTGIEMEVLSGCSIAALTIYDMCKAVDRSMCIKETRLISKNGGKSDYLYEG